MSQMPEVEKKLKNQRNGLLKLTAFLGIGVTVASIQKLGFAGLSLVSPLFVLGGESYSFSKMIANNGEFKRNAGLFTKFWIKRGFNKWMKNYFNNSEDMTEQKYKAIFLGLWLRQRNLKYEILVDYDNKVITELSKKLVTSKETAYFILDITNEHDFNTLYPIPIRKSQPSNTQSKLATLKDFLDEDFGNHKAINTAKKVYQEYKNNGFSIKFLDKNLEDFLSCMYLQDYKLNDDDYSFIKDSISQIKKDKTACDLPSVLNLGKFFLSEDEEIQVFNKIIENEDKIENLKILKDFLVLKATDYSFNFSKHRMLPFNVEPMVDCIEKRINYIELRNELNSNEKIEISQTQSMKVRKV